METMYRYKPEFLDMLNRCEYPNLAAEIYFCIGGSRTTYADHANITVELLEAFLDGEEEITATEFLKMARLNGNSAEYLSFKTLCVYDLKKQHEAKKLKHIFSGCRLRLTACEPECDDVVAGLAYVEKLSRMDGVILRAEINKLAYHVYMAELNSLCKQKRADRRGRNPSTCTDLSRKKTTASDGNLEAVECGIPQN